MFVKINENGLTGFEPMRLLQRRLRSGSRIQFSTVLHCFLYESLSGQNKKSCPVWPSPYFIGRQTDLTD